MRERLVFLHGFTQTHHHWHRGAHLIADRLGSEPTLAFVDLPGHGLSDADGTPIAGSGQSLARVGGRGTWTGYSMGARFALAAATSIDHSIDRLVLIGGTPGFIDEGERGQRRTSDQQLANRVVQVGVETFVDEWLAGPLFADLPDDPQDRQHRLANTAAGLASSLRNAGTGVQPPMWDSLARITIPVLVLAGARDAKFSEIGHRMVEALPNATFSTVDGAGHACHTEQPDRVADLIAAWILQTPEAERLDRSVL